MDNHRSIIAKNIMQVLTNLWKTILKDMELDPQQYNNNRLQNIMLHRIPFLANMLEIKVKWIHATISIN